MYLNRIEYDKQIFACDTFEGQPVEDEFGNFEKGSFSDIDLDQTREKFVRLNVDRVELRQGPFTDTLDTLSGPFSMAHIDCDVYQSVKYCLDNSYPRMAPGADGDRRFSVPGLQEGGPRVLGGQARERRDAGGGITWVIRKK
jgi:hypothetical protein